MIPGYRNFASAKLRFSKVLKFSDKTPPQKVPVFSTFEIDACTCRVDVIRHALDRHDVEGPS